MQLNMYPCSHIYINHLVYLDENYQCEDGHALITDDSWVLFCPPNEEVVSRSTMVLNMAAVLSPSVTIGKDKRIFTT